MAPTPDPAQLAGTVRSLDDQELEQQIQSLGPEEVLRAIFSGMQDAFIPEKAQGVTATMQYDIAAGETVHHWTVVIADGTCTTREGPADSPRLTLSLGIVDFVRLIFGQAEGPQLFMSGKLKLKGDMMFAMQMQNFFARDF